MRYRPLPLLTAGVAALLLAGCTASSPASPTSGSAASSAPSASAAPTSSATPSASGSTASGGTGGSGGSAGPATCATSQLQGSTAMGGGGAAGHVGIELVLTNSGSAACTLQGWPGVSFVGGGNGSQIGAPAQQDRQTYPHDTVTLQPRGQAFAPLDIVQALNYNNADCHPQKADGFRVYPPGSTQSLYIQEVHDACGSQVQLLTVSAVQATNLTAPH